MLTLNEVREAINRGDKKGAQEILEILLRENPSADAWYLAAKLTPNKEKAIKNLHQALLIDPDHGHALTLLSMLGGSPETFVGVMADEIADTIVEESNRRPLLRRLSRKQQIAAAFVFSLVGIGLLGYAVMLAISLVPKSNGGYAAVAPTPAPVVKVTADQLIRSIQSSGLQYFNLEITVAPQMKKGKLIRFQLQDGKGQQYPINIQVYDSVSALIESWNSGAGAAASGEVLGGSNAVMIYPRGLPDYLSTPLISSFRSVTGI